MPLPQPGSTVAASGSVSSPVYMVAAAAGGGGQTQQMRMVRAVHPAGATSQAVGSILHLVWVYKGHRGNLDINELFGCMEIKPDENVANFYIVPLYLSLYGHNGCNLLNVPLLLSRFPRGRGSSR